MPKKGKKLTGNAYIYSDGMKIKWFLLNENEKPDFFLPQDKTELYILKIKEKMAEAICSFYAEK